MGVTLRDVAAYAGVSFKTVSNVINNHPHVTEKTRAKVLTAIEALQYRPNQTARSLRHGRSGFLALAVPELASPYFSSLASEVSQAAKAYGRTVVIEETAGDLGREREALDELTTRLVDGIIFSPLATPRTVVEERLGTTPLVMIGEHRHPLAADHVAMDSVRAARVMTEHLLATGRRQIATIGYEPEGGTGGQRWLGYLQALDAAGLAPAPGLAAEVEAFRREDGARAMARLLDRPEPIDAVLCFNDLLALGAMRTLREARVAIPETIAVAGFDNIEDGRFAHPTLTTVAPDVQFLATEAVRLLVRRAEQPTAPAEHVEVPFTIEVRQSTTS
ncbi:MAG TPA: LacI family transcriptional regulator [Candidatus Ruania gallistercoris]|uniref:LacI family transcriptional regulator n=1 Tax=Candidatus Ruania gallistercoris TaxID=2838746 RepID=A0A9D2EH72_9MICO|nr:LacI family transcriptional regulator [Candidatus Ruania gallistercoris]